MGLGRVLLFAGRDIPDEFGELDIDTLKGKRCLLSVTTKTGADGSTFNKIADLLPVKPVRASKPGNGAKPVVVSQRSAPVDVPVQVGGRVRRDVVLICAFS